MVIILHYREICQNEETDAGTLLLIKLRLDLDFTSFSICGLFLSQDLIQDTSLHALTLLNSLNGAGHGVECKAHWTWLLNQGNSSEELGDLKIFNPCGACRRLHKSIHCKWGPSMQYFRQGRTLMGHGLSWPSCFPWPCYLTHQGNSEEKTLHTPSWLAPTCICQSWNGLDIQQRMKEKTTPSIKL